MMKHLLLGPAHGRGSRVMMFLSLVPFLSLLGEWLPKPSAFTPGMWEANVKASTGTDF